MYYLGADWYLENYIITETKEDYIINSFWHYWWYRGLLAAIDGDARICADFGILDSEVLACNNSTFINQIKFTRSEIARAFNVPVSLLNESFRKELK